MCVCKEACYVTARARRYDETEYSTCTRPVLIIFIAYRYGNVYISTTCSGNIFEKLFPLHGWSSLAAAAYIISTAGNWSAKILKFCEG